MVVADLHVHTTNSDGSLTLESLPEAAAAADLSVVAVTDHDRLHPDLEAPVADVGGLTVVHGIELRVETDAQRVDLLGYGARRTDGLEALVDRLQADRRERGRRIIGCVEDRLGVDLPVEPREGLGRPHVARAVEEATDHTYQDAFDDLIGDDCPCYVARDVPTFEEGVAILEEACGVVSLAHPLRYDDVGAALARCADLDAIERFYDYDGVEAAPHEAAIRDAIETHDLLVTGGSDAHDRTLGRAGLDREDYRRFRTALQG